jgi:hypothetical protein
MSRGRQVDNVDGVDPLEKLFLSTYWRLRRWWSCRTNALRFGLIIFLFSRMGSLLGSTSMISGDLGIGGLGSGGRSGGGLLL